MIYEAVRGHLRQNRYRVGEIITTYVLGGQSKAKAFCELHARSKIIELPYFKGSIKKDLIKSCHLDGDWHVSFQMHLFMAANSVRLNASSVNFGYVFQDDALAILPDFKRIWSDIVWLSAGILGRPRSDDIPSLEYPIKDTLKEHILQNIPKDILDLVWVCENPHPTEHINTSNHLFYPEGFAFDMSEDDFDTVASIIDEYKFVPCGNCVPCKRMYNEAVLGGYSDLIKKYSPKYEYIKLEC
jgi:hypothetical protein